MRIYRRFAFKCKPPIDAKTGLVGFIWSSVFLCRSSSSNWNFWSSKMSAIFDCSNPNRIPKQFLGPLPNTKFGISSKLLLASL